VRETSKLFFYGDIVNVGNAAIVNTAEKQGDQIGRIFATWAFTLGNFWKITEVSRIFGGCFFPRLRLFINFHKKHVGLRFWAIFSQTQLATFQTRDCDKVKIKLFFKIAEKLKHKVFTEP
jgi:hypothetical protein